MNKSGYVMTTADRSAGGQSSGRSRRRQTAREIATAATAVALRDILTGKIDLTGMTPEEREQLRALWLLLSPLFSKEDQ